MFSFGFFPSMGIFKSVFSAQVVSLQISPYRNDDFRKLLHWSPITLRFSTSCEFNCLRTMGCTGRFNSEWIGKFKGGSSSSRTWAHLHLVQNAGIWSLSCFSSSQKRNCSSRLPVSFFQIRRLNSSGPQPSDLCNNEVGMPTIQGSSGGWPGFTGGWPNDCLWIDTWKIQQNSPIFKINKNPCGSLVFRWCSLWLYHFVGQISCLTNLINSRRLSTWLLQWLSAQQPGRAEALKQQPTSWQPGPVANEFRLGFPNLKNVIILVVDWNPGG